MEKIVTILNFILISGILILFSYNYLYRSEVIQIKKQIGITPPLIIDKLLKINIWLSLVIFFGTLLLIVIIE